MEGGGRLTIWTAFSTLASGVGGIARRTEGETATAQENTKVRYKQAYDSIMHDPIAGGPCEARVSAARCSVGSIHADPPSPCALLAMGNLQSAMAAMAQAVILSIMAAMLQSSLVQMAAISWGEHLFVFCCLGRGAEGIRPARLAWYADEAAHEKNPTANCRLSLLFGSVFYPCYAGTQCESTYGTWTTT